MHKILERIYAACRQKLSSVGDIESRAWIWKFDIEFLYLFRPFVKWNGLLKEWIDDDWTGYAAHYNGNMKMPHSVIHPHLADSKDFIDIAGRNALFVKKVMDQEGACEAEPDLIIFREIIDKSCRRHRVLLCLF